MWEAIKNYLWEAVAVGGGSVLLILMEVARRHIAKRPPALMRFNEANQLIHQLLAEARVKLNAARAYVIQFRNGAKFDIQAPIFRLYMTHEVVGAGIAPVTTQWSALPASHVYELLTPLYPDKKVYPHATYPCATCEEAKDCAKRESGEAYWLKVKRLDEGTLKSMLIQQGTYNVLIAPMLDDGNVVGFVGVDYRKPDTTFKDDDCDYVCHAASNIVYELQRAIRETRRSWFGRAWHLLWSSRLSRQAGTDE